MVLALPVVAQPLTGQVAQGCEGLTAATDPRVSPYVFNWLFYLQSNNHIARPTTVTPAVACAHWLGLGVAADLQAHPGFHASEYLARHPDIARQFETKAYVEALTHYVLYGRAEGRVGYLENHAVGTPLQGLVTRGTIAGQTTDGPLYVSASARTAAAVDSVMWRNVEFINSYDLGRQLQIAYSAGGAGECYNPTEAGSATDYLDPAKVGASTSAMQIAEQSGSRMRSKNTPAFWLRPGESTKDCGPAVNTTRAAEHVAISKVIDVGYAGMSGVINFESTVALLTDSERYLVAPGVAWSMAVEAPTGYMSGEFTQLYTFDPASQVLKDISASAQICFAANSKVSCEQSKPVIFANGDALAIGVCAVAPGREYLEPAYGAFSFSFPGMPATSTNKWNVVHRRLGETHGPLSLSFKTLIAIGSLQQVREDMTALYARGECASR